MTTPRPTPTQVEHQPPTDAKSVLAELEAGNARFVAARRQRSIASHNDRLLREQLANGQYPGVALVTCADSRIVPEFIFDQTIGSIFDTRNAGNVVDGDVLATLEYGVHHLHIPLILVMGHNNCGAVQAILEAGDKELEPNLNEIQKNMSGLRPLIQKPHDNKSDFLLKLCEENARQQAVRLVKESKVLAEAVEKKHAVVVVGIYDLETGKVTILDRGSLDK